MAFEQFRKECADGKYKDTSWPDFVKYTGSYDATNDDSSPIASGYLNQVMYAFAGKTTNTVNKNFDNTLDELQEKMKNNNNMIINAYISGDRGYTANDKGNYYKNDKGQYIEITSTTVVPKGAKRYTFNGIGSNKGNIVLNGVGTNSGDTITITSNSSGGHALSITAITDDTVTIINPWDSDKEITVSRKDFESYMYSLTYSDVEKERGIHGGGGRHR
ncbi:hypothetical protein IJG14_05490 [bacterium]|nr:hypothetical protein [bacterium]